MHTGELLMAGANVLGSWFSRGADNAIFTWELIQAAGNATLTVTIWHKNNDEAGPGTQVSPSWSTTGAFRSAQVTELKELVRFEYTVGGDVGNGTVTVTDPPNTYPVTLQDIGWVMYRMLEPTWFDTITTGA